MALRVVRLSFRSGACVCMHSRGKVWHHCTMAVTVPAPHLGSTSTCKVVYCWASPGGIGALPSSKSVLWLPLAK